MAKRTIAAGKMTGKRVTVYKASGKAGRFRKKG